MTREKETPAPGSSRGECFGKHKNYTTFVNTIAATDFNPPNHITHGKFHSYPGLSKARQVAAAVGGDIIYPDFSDEEFTGADYIDFLTQRGGL